MVGSTSGVGTGLMEGSVWEDEDVTLRASGVEPTAHIQHSRIRADKKGASAQSVEGLLIGHFCSDVNNVTNIWYIEH